MADIIKAVPSVLETASMADVKVVGELLQTGPVKKFSDVVLFMSSVFPFPPINWRPDSLFLQIGIFIVTILLLIFYFGSGVGCGFLLAYLITVLIGYLYLIGTREGLFFIINKL